MFNLDKLNLNYRKDDLLEYFLVYYLFLKPELFQSLSPYRLIENNLLNHVFSPLF
jgi:hypothetical protein